MVRRVRSWFLLAGGVFVLASCGGSPEHMPNDASVPSPGDGGEAGDAGVTPPTGDGLGTANDEGVGTAPAIPQGLAASAGNAQVFLSWTASDGATRYHLKRSTTSGGPYTQVAAPVSAFDTDSSLTNGTTYYYVVSAINAAGESGNSAQASALPAVTNPSLPGCNLTSPAFCDTFEEGPTATQGREGDLDATKWSVAHLSPPDISGNAGAVANPVQTAPIPACKSSFSSTSVYPPNDTLICDPSGTRSSQLLTAVAIQNYGNNSYLIRQPFDFSGRTGKIDFDVDDGGGYQFLGGYPEIMITQDPVAAPTFQEFQNFETGPMPQNGISIKFSAGGTCTQMQASPINVMVFNGYAPTILPAAGTIGCVNISPGAMNHFEIQLSQTTVDVYGTDYSTDDGHTFGSLKHLYSATINLPFSRGYVHVNARNHATIKYGHGPDALFHWDNIGFDGPVFTNTRSYQIPDNTTMATYTGKLPDTTATVMNLGYQLQDGTVSGKPAGIYDPVKQLAPFQFHDVDKTGMTSARLSFSGFLDNLTSMADSTWGWQYRFNGGTWTMRTLTALEVTAINSTLNVGGAGSAGNLSMLIDVPLSALVDGTNTFEILPVHSPMSYPPVIANIDLTLSQ